MEKPDSRTASISPGSQPARILKVNMVKYVAMLYCEAESDTLNETLPIFILGIFHHAESEVFGHLQNVISPGFSWQGRGILVVIS